MPTITYRGETHECSDTTARHIARLTARATTDAAAPRKPAPVRYARVLDPAPNAVHDLLAQDRSAAVRDAVQAAVRPAAGFFTKDRREATIAANRSLNEKNRAWWAAHAAAQRAQRA